MIPRSPAESLLLAIARRDAGDAAIAKAIAGVDAWDRALGLLNGHGLLPLFGAHAPHGALPREVARRVAIAQIQTRHRNESTAGELVRFADALQEQGVPYAAYKGAVVAQRIYGDIALREYSDIDLLIDADRVPLVEQILRDLGCEVMLYADAHEVARNRRRGFEESWRSAKDAVLDLHWRLSDAFFPLRLPTAELLSRATTQQIGDRDVRTFSVEDDLIVLATHAARHFFGRLEWIKTIGEAMTNPRLDWPAILERVMRARCRVAFVTACRLAGLLDYPMPEALRSLDVAENDVGAIVAIVAREVFGDRSAFASRRAAMRLFDRRTDAWISMIKTIFEPRIADARAMPLPRAIRGGYYVLRPLRLAAKYVRRAIDR